MVLPDIIHDNQKCIPGRHIVNNIHVVNDLIKRIHDNKEGAALIFLDQEKAFDGCLMETCWIQLQLYRMDKSHIEQHT